MTYLLDVSLWLVMAWFSVGVVCFVLLVVLSIVEKVIEVCVARDER